MSFESLEREALLASIESKQGEIQELQERLRDEKKGLDERFECLARFVSPVKVGDRLLFKRLRKGGYGVRWGAKVSEDRYQPECWEVVEIGVKTEGEYGEPGLHWSARLVRITKSGERGKGGSQFIAAREGYMKLPHLHHEFKLGTTEVEYGGILEGTVIRDFRIEPAAEVER